MSTVNTGWLKDDNGEKFAPKTLSSQVITNDGVTLESVINENISTLEKNKSNAEHTHEVNDLNGIVSITKGGTGATTAADAITNLGAVDMTSEQEITGIKNFYNGIKIGNANLNFDSSVGALVISFPEGGE